MVSQGVAAGRFPIYTDADVKGALVKTLVSRGWDVVRAVDVHPEKTKDPVHFEEAAKRDRVLVSNDVDMRVLALRWPSEGRVHPGLIWWPRRHYGRMTIGVFVNAFERLAAKDGPFQGRPIIYLKPTE